MSFASWLQATADDLDLSQPGPLSSSLVQHGCHCTPALAADWLSGEVVPSFDKMRSIVAALQKASPDRDLWESFGSFSDEGSTPGIVVRAPQEDASLEAVLKGSPGLPPGLS